MKAFKAKLFRFLSILLLVSGLGCVASVIWAGFHYVKSDPRFNVRLITIKGLKRVEEDDVSARIKLRPGSNTNIFAVDMEDVRARVEQIDWVRYVTVQRVLPDEIIIRVTEREPIGLARIQGHIYEFDREAAILEPEKSTLPEFPILVGLRESDAERNLAKIAMYNKVIEDLGAHGISEVIVNQSSEVSVVRNEDPLIVNLGVDDFKERWSRYLKLKSTNDDDFKGAVLVDLRFRNKVIVSMEGDDDGGKVIWDGKKKSL
jgi:cell division protein FtsQ